MIYVVDFGSQTAHLISRRVRDLGINVEVVTPEDLLSHIKKQKPQGLIFSGGPSSVYEKRAPILDKKIFDLGFPILGICYGQQLTAHLLPGGKTVKGKNREDGPATLVIDKPCVLFEGFSPRSRIWMSHGDTVTKAPDGFEFTAHSETIPSASMQNPAKKICGLKTSKRKIDIAAIIANIKKTSGPARVIAAVSGGVDSTVAAALVAKAVGKQLTVIYCDNGLMRLGTADEVKDIFEKKLKVDLRIVDCKELFLKIS